MELCLLKFIKKYSSFTKKAIRIVHGSKYNSHTEPLFKELKILPLESLIKFFSLQFMQHYCTSFSNIWLTNEERRAEEMHHCILRNNNLLYVPFVRISTLSKHPLVNLPKTWLDFNYENIKILRNNIEFKA